MREGVFIEEYKKEHGVTPEAALFCARNSTEVFCKIVLEHSGISPNYIVVIDYKGRVFRGTIYFGERSDLRSVDGIFHLGPILSLIEKCLNKEIRSFVLENKTKVIWEAVF